MRCLGTPLVAGMGHPAPGGVKGIASSPPVWGGQQMWTHLFAGRPYNHTAAESELNLFKKTGAASVYSSVLGPWHSCLHTAGTQGLSGNDCPHFTDRETEAERG